MRAIIYTRVSNDPTGQGRSTTDQEQDCRRICAQRGWPVAEVLCDNDIGASRWSGKQRPAYQRLTELLAPGDILVTWEASRAQRDLAAYLQLRELCSARGVQWCYSGRLYDLTDGDDRFTTGLDALLAEKEAEQIRTRVLRGKRAAATEGRPAGKPAFGYRIIRDPDTGRTTGWEPHPDQAPVMIEAFQRVLAGEPIHAVWADQKRRGLPSPARAKELRQRLLYPCYAGLRKHQGEVIGKGAWEPLITVDQHHQIVALLTDPDRLRRHAYNPATKHLLTGIARCGVCGGPLRRHSARDDRVSPTYLCETGKCVRRRQDLVDELVTETLLLRLEQLDPSSLDTGDPAADAAAGEAAALQARLDAFTDQAADGGLSAAALARVEAKLLPQIRAARGRAATRPLPLPSQILGRRARQVWEAMTIVERREVVRTAMTVTVQRRSGTTRQFIPDDVTIDWLI